MLFVQFDWWSGFHIVNGWEGYVVETACGRMHGMLSGGPVNMVDQRTGNPGTLCGSCSDIESQNAYIPGASR